MKRKQIVELLEHHGICEGRMIAHSKTLYCERHPGHSVVFNSMVFCRRALVLRQADLDLTIDGVKLTAAAREVGENFFVVAEGHPYPFWEPGSSPIRQALRSATWWTRIFAEDQDVFEPVDCARRRPKQLRLTCVTSQWQGRPAYSVTSWANAELANKNMTGAGVEIAGQPPKRFRVKKGQPGGSLSVLPSSTHGHPVHPAFYQRSGLLEYIWFSCGAAIPAVIYDQVLRPLGTLDFRLHDEHEALHIRRDGQVVGLLWPCFIGAREVAANARRQLGLKAFKGSCLVKPERKQKPICRPKNINQ